MREQRGRVDCCRSCLRGLLRGLNYLLAIVGVLMTAYALFMYVQWSEQAPVPPVPSPSPSPASPSPAAPAHHHHHHHKESSPSPSPSPVPDPSPSALAQRYLLDQPSDPAALYYEASHLHEQQSQDDHGPSGTGTLAKCAIGTALVVLPCIYRLVPHARMYPWFIYVFGGAGAFVFITASIGILSADCAGCGVTCLLGLYHALMVLLLLLQITVVCFYFFDKSWEEDLPKDTTESRPRLAYSTLQQHDYESGSQASYPVAERIPGPHHRGGHGYSNARGRQGYPRGGADEPLDPEAGRGGGRGGGDDDDAPRRCSIM